MNINIDQIRERTSNLARSSQLCRESVERDNLLDNIATRVHFRTARLGLDFDGDGGNAAYIANKAALQEMKPEDIHSNLEPQSSAQTDSETKIAREIIGNILFTTGNLLNVAVEPTLHTRERNAQKTINNIQKSIYQCLEMLRQVFSKMQPLPSVKL